MTSGLAGLQGCQGVGWCQSGALGERHLPVLSSTSRRANLGLGSPLRQALDGGHTVQRYFRSRPSVGKEMWPHSVTLTNGQKSHSTEEVSPRSMLVGLRSGFLHL